MKREAIIKIQDPLTVVVMNTFDVTTGVDEENNIKELNVPGFPPFEVGRKLIIGSKKIPYAINKIIKKKALNGLPEYEIKIANRTKASLFILPMFKGPKAKYFYDELLLNCFLGVPGKDRVIALLYRFSGRNEFMMMEKAFKAMPNFIESYDPDKFTVLYVFDVPEKHMLNYELFLKGKYSKMSTAFKHRILQFHAVTKNSPIGHILYRSKARLLELESRIVDPKKYSNEKFPEDAEVYSVPNLTTETYDPEVYKL